MSLAWPLRTDLLGTESGIFVAVLALGFLDLILRILLGRQMPKKSSCFIFSEVKNVIFF